MADQFSPALRSWIMRQVKSKDTGPERIVRSLAHNMGYRFRLHDPNLPGKPDIVFPSRHKVVFVNGCFWHSHCCKRATLPVNRREYWANKIARTILRDRRHRRKLRSMGWNSLTIWECQLKNLSSVERRIQHFLAV
jgi:DNA mismatch endonuclease, patch repair protein